MSKNEADMTDIEYLNHSESYLQGSHDKLLEDLRTCKSEIEDLKVDMKVIKSDNLRKACSQIHNSLVKRKNDLLSDIKRILIDLEHVRSITKSLKRGT